MNKLKNILILSVLVLGLVGCSTDTITLTSVRVQRPHQHKIIPLEIRRAAYAKKLHSSGIQIIKLGQTMHFILLSDYIFNPDSANIRENYREVLRILAALISTYDKVDVKVSSYTDDLDHRQRQQALTTCQAQVLANFLWAQGINARLAYSEGLDQKNPVDSNNTLEGRHNNRRVEVSFKFYPKYNAYN